MLNQIPQNKPITTTPKAKPEAVETETKRQVFVNDLSPEEREQAVAEYADRIREQLSGETIRINCMSRLLNMAHPRVTALLAVTASAKEALLDSSANKVVRAKSLLSKLTEEQRAVLLKDLQNKQHS